MKLNWIAIIALLLFTSCAVMGGHPRKMGAEAQRGLYTVKGEVLWKGEAPIVYPIPISAYDGACGKRQAQWLLKLKKSRVWHKRLLDVAVWLEPVWKDMTPEQSGALKMSQVGRAPENLKIVEKECQFNPSLTVVPVGTRIEVSNEDRKDHWFILEGEHRKKEQYVQYYGELPTVFTFETPGVHRIPQGEPVTFVADKVDNLRLVSGFHLWMEAWVVVTNKIWFDDSIDKYGYFEITNVPSGVYRVNTWHPVLGGNSVLVKIPEDVRDVISVNYNETPHIIEKLTSTVITTSGEVRQQNDVWDEIEEW